MEGLESTGESRTAWTAAQDPVSLAESTNSEKDATNSLLEFLLPPEYGESLDVKDERRRLEIMTQRAQLEEQELQDRRNEVLMHLSELVTEFVRTVYQKKHGESGDELEEIRGGLLPYGSYYLGVATTSSDIDCICLVPHFVTRRHFFTILYEVLKSHSSVTDLDKIEQAISPILTFKFAGIEIDLSCSILDVPTIPLNATQLPIDDDHILDNVDEQTVISLNGRRTNNMILALVKDHREGFRTLLRFLRIWAKKRGLTGNVFGYLGGVNMAIMSVWICQRYPNATAAVLLQKFFSDFASWEWPNPIYINTPTTGSARSWDPNSKDDRRDLMPIITPAYPAINSMRSATRSSKARLIEEFQRGKRIIDEVIAHKRPWSDLIAEPMFFVRYRKYVQVVCWAQTSDEFRAWKGTVQSRVRRLGQYLDELHSITNAFVYPEFYDIAGYEDHQFAGCFFLALSYHIPKEELETRSIDITEPAERFIRDVMTDPRSNRKPGMDIGINIIDKADIPLYVFPNHARPQRTRRPPKAPPEEVVPK